MIQRPGPQHAHERLTLRDVGWCTTNWIVRLFHICSCVLYDRLKRAFQTVQYVLGGGFKKVSTIMRGGPKKFPVRPMGGGGRKVSRQEFSNTRPPTKVIMNTPLLGVFTWNWVDVNETIQLINCMDEYNSKCIFVEIIGSQYFWIN